MAERRAQALTLDRDLLRELLGQEELRELLDPAALADLELSLQALVEERQAKTADQVHDLLRRLGDLGPDEAGARTVGGRVEASLHLAELAASRRAVRARIAGEERWIAIEDVARYRDGVGVSAPPGVPQAFLAPAAGALDGLLARYARTHGPFLGSEPARRWGLPVGVVEDALHRLVAAGSLLSGEFRPGGAEREFCDPEVLRLLRRRSLATLRREVEPVDPVTLARFLPAWHGVAASPSATGSAGSPFRGSAALERLAEVVDQLAGLPIPASVLERDVLPARIPGYQPRLLDELGAMGEVAWVGRGSLGRDDGRVVLLRPGRELLRPGGLPDGVERPAGEIHERLRAHLRSSRCLLLPGAVRRLRGAVRSRGARRALGPRLGRRGHQRHLRPAASPALEAAREGPPAATGTPDGPGAPGGRRPLVAGGRRGDGRGRRADAHRAHPRPGPRPARAPRRAHSRGRCRRSGGRWLLRGLPGPARARGGGTDPPRVLRGRPRSGPVRAPGCRRPAACAARPARRAGRRARARRPSPGGGRSSEPVRGRDPVAAARRGRPAPVPARRRGIRRDGRRRGGALPGPRRDVAPGAAGRR